MDCRSRVFTTRALHLNICQCGPNSPWGRKQLDDNGTAGWREYLQISLPACQLPVVGALQVVLPLSFTMLIMEQRCSARAGETGEPGENPPTNGIVRHDSHSLKIRCDAWPGIEPSSLWWEESILISQPAWPPSAPTKVDSISAIVGRRTGRLHLAVENKQKHNLTKQNVVRISLLRGATVAEGLECSPPTKAFRVQSPVGSLRLSHMGIVPDDAVGQRVFSEISRFLRSFVLTSITLIDSKDLDVKSLPNLFTHFTHYISLQKGVFEEHLFTEIGVFAQTTISQKARGGTRHQNGVTRRQKVGTSFANQRLVSFSPGRTRPMRNRSQNAVANPIQGPVLRASSSQSANGYAHIILWREYWSRDIWAALNRLTNNSSVGSVLELTIVLLVYTTPGNTMYFTAFIIGREVKGRCKRHIPEKTRRPAASFALFPNAVIVPGLPSWESSSPTATSTLLLQVVHVIEVSTEQRRNARDVGNERSPRKPTDQRHRPAQLNPVRPVGRRAGYRVFARSVMSAATFIKLCSRRTVALRTFVLCCFAAMRSIIWLADEIIYIIWLADEITYIIWLADEITYIIWLSDEIAYIIWLADEITYIIWLADEITYIIWLADEITYIIWLADEITYIIWLSDEITYIKNHKP
ncbi:hypothetical protein PR048_027842 [Dryococelus australis]|uniref:Uncharacterized protein n=1 Tax=Dryococelus australis TaxID=614101 RepID=A0ABQ9GHN1_9NEOP|nr:hypothetical protein PR048_027842 [Dryococelus australis]